MADNTKEKVENKIIDLVALNASGRLVVFKPEKSDVDLVVEKKNDYKKNPIFLKIYSRDSLKEIEQLQINPAENLYLVFIDFDFIKQELEDSFLLIPSLKLINLLDAKNFSNFLVNKNDFVRFLIEKI